MKYSNIASAELPNIDDTIKESVNLGQWLLFRANLGTDDQSLYLKAGETLYKLSKDGRILSVVDSKALSGHLLIEELLYFSDIDQPQSLSNAKYASVRY